ncbi:MAG: HlyD family type I secretion periplasmic adaptor subunit [Gallionellaceae bacterium]|nr:MAG: HlyD family type I secretion periplasmic adaptor subunit [Gallionellaceae bacterium]
MEPTDKPPVAFTYHRKPKGDATAIEFLPDADELERRPYPQAAQLTVHVLLLLLLGFLLWATFSDIDEVVVARGRLITPLPNIIVQPLETSIIQSIDVRVGQVVRKGDHLATLDPTFAQADEAELRARLRSLDTQTERLEAELSGSKSIGRGGSSPDSKLQSQLAAERLANYRAQHDKMEQNIAQLRAAQESNRLDQRMLESRVKNIIEIEAMQEKLVQQNFAPPLKLLEERERRLGMERELQLAKNKAQELARQLAALEAEKVAFERSWRQKTMEDLLSTSRDREALNEQVLKADKRRSMVEMVAPADAVVLEIAKLSQGSVARGTEAMFTLVPLDSPLEAEVEIDAGEVGYVKNTDVARIKFDAFPFQKHGMLEGTLRTISGDAFRREGGRDMGAYYLGRINLGEKKLEKMPKGARLLPGMALSAEIVVGKRSVISYLLWPLTKAVGESMQEP